MDTMDNRAVNAAREQYTDIRLQAESYEPEDIMENDELLAELFMIAKEAAENAYAPYSGFHVGAALLAKDGRVFTGCNVESASYGATICAERTALVKAVSEGVREFSAIAVIGGGGEAWPCGTCRQMLYEFSPQMVVITGFERQEGAAEIAMAELIDLLPCGFRLQRSEAEDRNEAGKAYIEYKKIY